MKVIFRCTTCLMETPGKLDPDQVWTTSQELSDEDAYETRCPKGHLIRFVLQVPRYDVLFDGASLALLDGYHREAIATYACALERFFEFFVRVAHIHLAIEGTQGDDRANAVQAALASFDATWKFAKQSERQFGMFLFAHLALTHAAPAFQKNKYEDLIRTRNNVVHAGAIVSQKQAIEFGQGVADVIAPLLQTLKSQCDDAIQLETWARIRASSQNLPPNDGSTKLGVGSMFHVGVLGRLKKGDGFWSTLEDFSRSNIWTSPAERITLQRLADALGTTPKALAARLQSELEQAKEAGQPLE